MPENDAGSMNCCFENMTVKELLARFSACRPLLPAGGSAAALLGALAAAMGAFVARVTSPHIKAATLGKAIKDGQNRFDELQHRLTELMEADAKAYDHDFLGPPLQVLEAGVEMMELCRVLYRHCHAPARADMQVFVETAMACIRSAAAIIRENAERLTDEQEAQRIREHITGSLQKARQIRLSLSDDP